MKTLPSEILPYQFMIAARMWVAGRDTQQIASHLGVREHAVYNGLDKIKRISAQSSVAELLHQSGQNLTDTLEPGAVTGARGGHGAAGAFVLPAHPPSFIKVDNSAHQFVSNVSATHNSETDRSEVACPKNPDPNLQKGFA